MIDWTVLHTIYQYKNYVSLETHFVDTVWNILEFAYLKSPFNSLRTA